MEYGPGIIKTATLDRHERSMLSGGVWKDISEDAVEDIIQLWRAAHGWMNDSPV